MSDEQGEVAHAAPLTTCHACERTVPEGEFCGACGAHLTRDMPRSAYRHHAFAANPAEHVLHLRVVSTLFPHLPHRRTAPFQIALIVAAALLLVLGVLRLTGPSVAAASIAVPILYLVYLYEVEVYEDEPVRVIGSTFLLGLLLGIPWSIFVGPIITRAYTDNEILGFDWSRTLTAGVLLPLIAQLLMLSGALVLYLTRRFDEALDGFTFGAATALGFTLAVTFVNLLPEVSTGFVSRASSQTSAIDVLQRGLLLPVLNASTTGLIGGALWLRRRRVRPLAAHGWTTKLVTAILVAVIVQVALGLVDISFHDLGLTLAALVGLALLLLLAVRIALHHMLLAEAVEVQIGPDTPCFHCYRIVPRMAFCPHCGIATRATPKSGIGRLGRAFR